MFYKGLSLVCLFEQCLQHLDVSVLGELVPRLCELLKSGVGLGTKVNTTHTDIYLLSQYHFLKNIVTHNIVIYVNTGTK